MLTRLLRCAAASSALSRLPGARAVPAAMAAAAEVPLRGGVRRSRGAAQAEGAAVVGVAATPEVETIAHRDLQLAEHGDGSAAVIDAASRDTLIEVGPESGAFAVEVLRNLARDRIRKGASTEGPYVLALKADGRLVVEDPQTRQQVELRAFGKLQAEVFAELMPVTDAATRGSAK